MAHDRSKASGQRILISGGGIAGLTLAYWLQHHGLQPTIVEPIGDRQRRLVRPRRLQRHL